MLELKISWLKIYKRFYSLPIITRRMKSKYMNSKCAIMLLNSSLATQKVYIIRKIAQTPDFKILVPTTETCCLQTSALSVSFSFWPPASWSIKEMILLNKYKRVKFWDSKISYNKNKIGRILLNLKSSHIVSPFLNVSMAVQLHF